MEEQHCRFIVEHRSETIVKLLMDKDADVNAEAAGLQGMGMRLW